MNRFCPRKDANLSLPPLEDLVGPCKLPNATVAFELFSLPPPPPPGGPAALPSTPLYEQAQPKQSLGNFAGFSGRRAKS